MIRDCLSLDRSPWFAVVIHIKKIKGVDCKIMNYDSIDNAKIKKNTQSLFNKEYSILELISIIYDFMAIRKKFSLEICQYEIKRNITSCGKKVLPH